MTALLRVSEETHRRILVRIGAVALAIVLVAVAGYVLLSPSDPTPADAISVQIETPYVGQGVGDGTPVIMHGVKVGEVTSISSLPGGRVRLATDLQAKPMSGLTDAMDIDFRPANYFGVTGINLIPADGGRPLRNGMQLTIRPKGNFALQALLYRLGEISNQVVTPRLVSVFDRATRFTDGLNPLLETMITVSTTVTNTQTVSTEQLLRNVTGISVAVPGFLDALINTGDDFLFNSIGIGFDPEVDLKNNPYVSTYDDAARKQYDSARHLLATNPDAFVFGRFKEWLKGAESDLFAPIGKLISSHVYELFPIVDQIRVMADVVPKLIPVGDITNTLRELRTRLERMYAGSGEQRALQVRIILDALPGVAGPFNLALGMAG